MSEPTVSVPGVSSPRSLPAVELVDPAELLVVLLDEPQPAPTSASAATTAIAAAKRLPLIVLIPLS